jgi:hypothetical protein
MERQVCLCVWVRQVSTSMESRGRNGGIGVDIGCGGARESSRQSGRTERKLPLANQRGALASPRRHAPSPATPHHGEGRQARLPSCLSLAWPAYCRWWDCLRPFIATPSHLPARFWHRGLHRGAGRQSYSCQPRVASRCTHRGTASSIANGCLDYFITLSRYSYHSPTSILRHNCYTHASVSLPRTGKQCPQHVQRKSVGSIEDICRDSTLEPNRLLNRMPFNIP